MLELKQLTKNYLTKTKGSYQKLTAVDHIDLVVETGKVCVLLGTSGCGKSTTLKMINRLVEPSSGEILIDHESIFNMSKIDLRRNIGYVIQSIGLFPNMTIFDNITIVPKLLDWQKDQRKEQAFKLLEMVALPTSHEFLARYPYQLSGGQQQRIGVIRAMAGNPKLLLMDEPFGAIDPINRTVIQDEFKKIQQKHHLTVVFVSHDVEEALKIGDTIAIFDQGQIIQHATPHEILAHPKNDFIANFIGADRSVKRIKLFQAHQAINTNYSIQGDEPRVSLQTNLMDIVSLLYTCDCQQVVCIDQQNNVQGAIRHRDIYQLINS